MTLTKDKSGRVKKIECTPEELIQVLELIKPQPPSADSWVKPLEGSKMIGKKLTLTYAKTHGIDFRQVGKGKVPRYEYNKLSIYNHKKNSYDNYTNSFKRYSVL